MAETHIQASFAFTCSHTEMALLEEAFLAADNLVGDFDSDPPSQEFLAAFPPSADDIWAGFRRLFADPGFPCLGAEISGGNSTEHPDRNDVYVSGMTDSAPNAVACLIQRCCPSTLSQSPIGFEYCWNCSKPRPGEFGGGWCVIPADRIDSGTTGEALSAALRT
ncbi:hypothetical protein [Sphingomonas sp. 1185]|uniref:hypothetical protein n=1 Tax=Sphingomonas sp. 1185 TaxID=3156411 RepID=UPI00339864BA